MNLIKTFKSDKWWRQKNPAYRESCKRLNRQELVELKGQYDFYIKHTVK